MPNIPNLSDMTQKWVDMLLPFSSGYSTKISLSELSKMSGVPQQTASRYMRSLVKSNLISYERRGRNKLFYFDLNKATTKTVFNLIESRKALLFQLKSKDAIMAIGDMLKHCEGIVVFGSYASEEQRKDSDLDLVILGKTEKAEIKKIKQKQFIEINEHYSSFSGFKKMLSERNPLAIEIMNNHILLGNVSKIVDVLLRRL